MALLRSSTVMEFTALRLAEKDSTMFILDRIVPCLLGSITDESGDDHTLIKVLGI